MTKQSFAKITVLLIASVLTSCSGEDAIEPSHNASRNIITPIQNGTVRIGTQIWMTKNLNANRYRNGDPIPQVIDSTQWANLTTGAWCYYNNDLGNGRVYGKLYNWYAVNDPRGLAPTGYHVPSDMEWTTLITFLGGEIVAGNNMKATTGWDSYLGITNTNSSGFTGFPGGNCYYGTFYGFGWLGVWWSSVVNSTANAWMCYLYYNDGTATMGYSNKTGGFSVRCLKD